MTRIRTHQVADDHHAIEKQASPPVRGRRTMELTIFTLVVACTLSLAAYIRADAERNLARAQLEAGQPNRAALYGAGSIAAIDDPLAEDDKNETVTP